jgi:hypothetical protein
VAVDQKSNGSKDDNRKTKSKIARIKIVHLLNRNSERIPRSLLRGLASESKNDKLPYGRSSPQLAAGSFNISNNKELLIIYIAPVQCKKVIDK